MSNGIIFNYIPGSGLVAPGQFFEENSGGQYTAVTRLILQGYMTSAGTMQLNTPVPVSTQQQADAYAGPGSMLREMFRVAAANAPAQQIWLEAVAAPATTAASWTITVNTVPAAGQGTFEVAGRQMTISVTSADTVTTVAASIAAAINAFYDTLTGAMLPVTATSALGVVTLTARHPGIGLATSMLVDLFIDSTNKSNVLGAAGVATIVTATAGTGTPPSMSSAFSALGDDPADFIVSPFSDSATMTAAEATLGDVSGRWSWSRQSYGIYWTALEGNFAALTTFGLAMNDRHISVLGAYSPNPTPVWEWVAAICARQVPWLSDVTTGNVSRNMTGLVVQGIRGPRNRSVLWGYTSRNTLLNSGISTVQVDSYGNVLVDKTITTYQLGPLGQPDTVFRDIQSMYQASLGLGYIRAVTATQLGQRSFAATNPGNLAAIATPADVKACFISAYTQLVNQGVYQDPNGFANNLVVQANTSNPNRCDVLAPIERVNPLDILAVNATFYQQYPASFA